MFTSAQLWDAILARNGGRFLLHYQPMQRLADGARCYEVLLRFQYGGAVYPLGDFLDDVVKLPDLAQAIDRWVIEEVHKQNPDICYTVNLFPQSIKYGLVRYLSAFNRSHNIILELTEREPINETGWHELKGLAKLYPIWLDDMGSGWASASPLQSGVFSGFKIAGNICKNVVDNKISRALVAGKMRIAALTGLECVIESVESPQILRVIQELASELPECRLWVQGYGIQRPGEAC